MTTLFNTIRAILFFIGIFVTVPILLAVIVNKIKGGK